MSERERRDVTAPEQQGNETGPDAEENPTYTCGELYELGWRAEDEKAGTCPVQVSLGKISVVLRQPARGAIQLDTGHRGKGGRFSTGTQDLQVAIGVAEEWLKERQAELLADGKLERVRPDTITVDQAMTILERHRPPKEQPRRLTEFRFVANLARAIWGSQRRVSAIDQIAVEQFEHVRREKGVTFPDGIDHRPVASGRRRHGDGGSGGHQPRVRPADETQDPGRRVVSSRKPISTHFLERKRRGVQEEAADRP